MSHIHWVERQNKLEIPRDEKPKSSPGRRRPLPHVVVRLGLGCEQLSLSLSLSLRRVYLLKN